MNNKNKVTAALTLGALGIVFGDIGTSPLYAFNVIFGKAGRHVVINQTNVLGIISLVVWSITLVVAVKYIAFVMRADNAGEGGIMALISQIRGSNFVSRYKWPLLFLGIAGVGLFYGDSTITPAVSVLSAVEGLKVIAPGLSSAVVPVTLVILAVLFAIQRYGTGTVGKLFGPVMFIWFVVLGLAGGAQVVQYPHVLISLAPWTAISFFATHPVLAFVAMGSVVLAVTGAEALYADMGHFGRRPIRRAWFLVVFPALLLCYMGEGALLLHNPGAARSPLVLLFPSVFRLPFVLLATLATVIASQSVISGAFSLTRQAVQLNFLPRLTVRHTSVKQGGQVYVPFVNAVLFIVVAVLVLLFGSSARLANAYGLAVSGTLAADSILYLAVVRYLWHKSSLQVAVTGLLFVPIDLLFISSSAPKLLRGGWFPLAIGVVMVALIGTWVRGERIIIRERRRLEGSMQNFADEVHTAQPPVLRIPGAAVYIGHHVDYAPLALKATLEELHELHEKVVIVTVLISALAHIPQAERAVYDELGYDDGISHVILTVGFHDHLNVPEELKLLRHRNSELNFDPDKAAYFVSLSRIVPSKRHNLPRWQKNLYCLMAQNTLNTADYYKLPTGRTVEMASLLKL